MQSPSAATTCHSVNEEGVMKADQATGVYTYGHLNTDKSSCSQNAEWQQGFFYLLMVKS